MNKKLFGTGIGTALGQRSQQSQQSRLAHSQASKRASLMSNVIIDTGKVPVDLDKVKTAEDLLAILRIIGVQFKLPDTKEAHKYATKEWLKENASRVSPLGKAINSEDK